MTGWLSINAAIITLSVVYACIFIRPSWINAVSCGFIFGIIAVALNPSEVGDGFKPITKYKNKARGFGISALTGGAIGIVLMIFNMLRLGGYI